jgi:hypothetical protein
MNAYFLVIQAEDGEHVHRYDTIDHAKAGLEEQVGRKIPEGQEFMRTIDDWGRTMVIEAWPTWMDEATRREYGRAYDARECGTATVKQLNLLARIERTEESN